MEKLTHHNRNSFFDNIKKGELFTYSTNMLLTDVRQVAIQNGWMIQYYPPGTPEYKEHGSQTCKVVQRLRWIDAEKICELRNYLI